MSLIISSVFYDMQSTTSSFFQRGALLFFAVLLSAFSSSLEVRTPQVYSFLDCFMLKRKKNYGADPDFVCPTADC